MNTLGVLLEEPSTESHRNVHAEMALTSTLLRIDGLLWPEIVRVYNPKPTLALTSRDMRSKGAADAIRLGEAAGFTVVVRPAGGRMVAYDAGAVIIDHIRRPERRKRPEAQTFKQNAEQHASLLRRTFGVDARVGLIPGEYCPGEFSVNVAGRGKVIGSAQRVVGSGSLFSTVVQVDMSPTVRDVIVGASAALGYSLNPSTIYGLAEQTSCTSIEVAEVFRNDYLTNRSLVQAVAPAWVTAAVDSVPAPVSGHAFAVETWARSHDMSRLTSTPS